MGFFSLSYCVWAPNYSGASSAVASAGMNPPLSPRTKFLPIPVDDPHLAAPLYTTPRGDGVECAAASTMYPVPYPVLPFGVTRSVRRDSILFVVLVIFVVALEILTLHTSYHQLSPPTQNWLCQLLCMSHLKELTKLICHEMHPGVITEVQMGAFYTAF